MKAQFLRSPGNCLSNGGKAELNAANDYEEKKLLFMVLTHGEKLLNTLILSDSARF